MSLSDKMFNRSTPGCGFGTDCRKESDRHHFDELFAREWDVFVIKHDAKKGKYNWFTLCCEEASRRGCTVAGAC